VKIADQFSIRVPRVRQHVRLSPIALRVECGGDKQEPPRGYARANGTHKEAAHVHHTFPYERPTLSHVIKRELCPSSGGLLTLERVGAMPGGSGATCPGMRDDATPVFSCGAGPAGGAARFDDLFGPSGAAAGVPGVPGRIAGAAGPEQDADGAGRGRAGGRGAKHGPSRKSPIQYGMTRLVLT
jgi:hypothetical protein